MASRTVPNVVFGWTWSAVLAVWPPTELLSEMPAAASACDSRQVYP